MLKCDICGVEFEKNEYQCGRFAIEKCDLCGRNVCEKCTYNTIFSPISESLFINVICKECAKVGKKYMTRVSELQRKHTREELQIINEWRDKVGSKSRQKKKT